MKDIKEKYLPKFKNDNKKGTVKTLK